MKKMIGYCGYNCYLCAARSNDAKKRQKLVDGWRRMFGHQCYTAENVFCVGCKGKGRVADHQCKARPCAQKKNIEFCVQCDKFACDKVRDLMGCKEAMLIRSSLKGLKITEAEYNLCMRQFDSMGNVVEQLIKAKKLPPWVKKVFRKK